MGLYEDLLQNYNAKLIAGGAAQNTARGAQVLLSGIYVGEFPLTPSSTSSLPTRPSTLAASARTSTPIS